MSTGLLLINKLKEKIYSITYCDCVVFTPISSATEALLNIAEMVITNTANITVVSLSPLGDDFRILLTHFGYVALYFYSIYFNVTK